MNIKEALSSEITTKTASRSTVVKENKAFRKNGKVKVFTKAELEAFNNA